VTKEYYLNDAGVQMQTLGRSVWLRMQELEGKTIEFPENCYQGAYVKDIAKEVIATGKKFKSDDEAIAFCGQYAGGKIHNEIVKDLADCGVTHDVYFNESELHKKDLVNKTVEFLRKRGYVYDSEGAIWFKTTAFGDEKDRVLKKSDGFFTYFAADIAYHKQKYDRGFDRIIDVWGADHAGHVPRMKSAIEAMGHNPGDFDAVLIQLVNLIRGGQLVSMSTRSAQYETLRTLLDEVGRDVCRYFFLMRSHDAQLDFDIELAKSQTMENPVYYIQYAHARISSVFAKADEAGIKLNLAKADTDLLDLPEEAALARYLSEYPEVIRESAVELAPHKISFYLLELAKKFQSYYTKGKKDERYRFLSDDAKKTAAKCYLLKNIQIVLKNGLDLLGVSAPERMASTGAEQGDLR
jgi:arginyl-tRNA synthetase